MPHRRRRNARARTERDDARDEDVLRDAEESLVAALQESDTAAETLADAQEEHDPHALRRHWRLGVAGAVLALAGLLVTRRRRC